MAENHSSTVISTVVTYRVPLVSCGDGHVFWTNLKDNRLFIVQQHKLGEIGQLVRQAKLDHDPQPYRIITQAEPFFEVAVSNTQQGILQALEQIEKELMPRVFGLSHKKFIAVLPLLIKALQSGKISELDSVMTNFYSSNKTRLDGSTCLHCGKNSKDARLEPCGHQPMCIACADMLLIAEGGPHCPSCGGIVKKTIKVEL